MPTISRSCGAPPCSTIEGRRGPNDRNDGSLHGIGGGGGAFSRPKSDTHKQDNDRGDGHKPHGGGPSNQPHHGHGGEPDSFAQAGHGGSMGGRPDKGTAHGRPFTFASEKPDVGGGPGVKPLVGSKPPPPPPPPSAPRPNPPPPQGAPPPPTPKPRPASSTTTKPKPTDNVIITHPISSTPLSESALRQSPSSSATLYHAMDPSLSSETSTASLIVTSNIGLSTGTSPLSQTSFIAQTTGSTTSAHADFTGNPSSVTSVQPSEKRLSAGSIGGIATVAALASVLLVCFLLWLCRRRVKSRHAAGSYGLVLDKNVETRINSSDIVPFDTVTNDPMTANSASGTRPLSKLPMSPRYESWSITVPFAARYSATDLGSSSPRSTMSSAPPPYLARSRQSELILGDLKVPPEHVL